MTKLPTLGEIRQANPSFFDVSLLLGDEKYEIYKEGGRIYLDVDTRYTTPTYLVKSVTLKLVYSHDRGFPIRI